MDLLAFGLFIHLGSSWTTTKFSTPKHNLKNPNHIRRLSTSTFCPKARTRKSLIRVENKNAQLFLKLGEFFSYQLFLNVTKNRGLMSFPQES